MQETPTVLAPFFPQGFSSQNNKDFGENMKRISCISRGGTVLYSLGKQGHSGLLQALMEGVLVI